MQVSEILATKGATVVTTGTELSIAGVARELRAHNVGAVVVIDHGRIAGILSERDIVRGIALHGERTLAMKVRDLMTTDVRTCSPRDLCRDLMAVMTEHRVRHLPVVDDEGRLAGIISIGDVVKQRVAEIDAEAETLREYIAAR